MTRCHQMTSQQRRSGHPEKQWYLMQERRDSRLISPKSCPTDWVHLSPKDRRFDLICWRDSHSAGPPLARVPAVGGVR
jgi:hypothetical protein